MPANQSKSNSEFRTNELILRSFKSGMISFIIFILISALITFMSMKNGFIKENFSIIGYTVLGVCSLICGYLSAGKIKVRGIISGSFSALFLIIAVYITFLVANNAEFSNKTLLVIPVALIFSIIGAILRKNKRHKK